jgi:conjugal transfer pilus assembly protein TraW
MGANRQNISAIVVMLIIWMPFFAFAKDFGVVGHTYNIEEQDIIKYIKSKLEQIDIAKLQEEQQQIVRTSVERPKEVAGIIDAKENREYFYDPTFILEEDIFDHVGRLIQKSGTRINPLEKISLRHDLIFINGDNLKQVEFALSYFKTKDAKATIILIKGSPIKLQKEHKIWIYFDQQGLLTGKFGITQVPAIVTQDQLQLKIREVVL